MRLQFLLAAVLVVDASLLESPGVDEFFKKLLVAGGYGRLPHERGGFLRRLPDGSYQGQLWSFSPTAHKAVFHGTIPPGTIAIVHTHPRNIPRPSAEDEAVAKRLSLPVVVLTPRSIAVVDPSGEVRRIAAGWWAEEGE